MHAVIVALGLVGVETASTAAPLAPSPADVHPCREDPRSRACARACRPAGEHPACVNVCRNNRAVDWCWGWCESHPDRSCLGYREPADCPEFEGPLWRVGLRVLTEAQLLDPFGGTAGAEIQVGRRVSPEWSVVAEVGGGVLGVDTDLRYLPSFSATVGAEWLDHDRLAPRSALGLSAQAGGWLTRPCRARADCPFAFPYAEVGARFLEFWDGPDPYYRPFLAHSWGVDLGLGYDPWLERWLGRLTLTVGFELAFR